ncbi:MAG: NAD(P) transhydrogenase subunit beta, partial [uncultured Rubrobacteraceae bacterium]
AGRHVPGLPRGRGAVHRRHPPPAHARDRPLGQHHSRRRHDDRARSDALRHPVREPAPDRGRGDPRLGGRRRLRPEGADDGHAPDGRRLQRRRRRGGGAHRPLRVLPPADRGRPEPRRRHNGPPDHTHRRGQLYGERGGVPEAAGARLHRRRLLPAAADRERAALRGRPRPGGERHNGRGDPPLPLPRRLRGGRARGLGPARRAARHPDRRRRHAHRDLAPQRLHGPGGGGLGLRARELHPHHRRHHRRRLRHHPHPPYVERAGASPGQDHLRRHRRLGLQQGRGHRGARGQRRGRRRGRRVPLGRGREGNHSSRLRPRRGPGTERHARAYGGAGVRGQDGPLRHPPRRRPHAGPHERPPHRSRRPLRQALRPRGHKPRARRRRRRHYRGRKRRREPCRQRRGAGQPHKRHAHPQRRGRRTRDLYKEVPQPRLRGRGQPPLLRHRQDHDALLRRQAGPPGRRGSGKGRL